MRIEVIGEVQRAARLAESYGSRYLDSLMEFETLVRIAVRLGYLKLKEESEVLSGTDEIGKMLSGLRRSLNPQS